MKLQILNNTKYNLTNEKKGFIDYFKKHSVDFTVAEQSVIVPTPTFVFRHISGFNADTGKAQILKQMKLNDSIRNDLRSFVDDSEIVIFVYEAGKQKPDEMITNWTEKNAIKNNTVFIQVVINDYLLTTGKFLLSVKHELMHALCYITGARDEMDMAHNGIAYYHNDQPDNPDSNFGFTWNNLKPFLNKQSIIANIMAQLKVLYAKLEASKKKYRNFSESEVIGLKEDFILRLDEARDIAGIPFIINSGFRTKVHNKAVGGVADSSHLTGLAVDLKAMNDTEQWLITNALMRVGIKRITVYTKSNHIHCDMDYSKNNPTLTVLNK